MILASAAIAASVSAGGSRRTVVHHFHAFRNGKVAPGVHVTHRARGYCWEPSNVESRPYAWRCFRGNYIHDPCFSSTRKSRYVLCPTEPWSRNVVRLGLTRALPPWSASRSTPRLPVGIWTTTGKRCAHSSGATSEIGGMPITYECVGGGVLAGLADRNGGTWTIRFASSFKSRHLTRVGITDAWW